VNYRTSDACNCSLTVNLRNSLFAFAGAYEVLGSALDDPPGAVFDKVARSLQIVERIDKNKRSTGKHLEEIAKSGNW